MGLGPGEVTWMLAKNNARPQESRECTSIEPVPLQVPVGMPPLPKRETDPRGGEERNRVLIIDQVPDEQDGPGPGVVIIDLC
ncbi:MAG TPA: hypothetical protein VH877_16890 [Polyangia bacterium]|nr:hypothetical protein [Polyangia bacterium]